MWKAKCKLIRAICRRVAKMRVVSGRWSDYRSSDCLLYSTGFNGFIIIKEVFIIDRDSVVDNLFDGMLTERRN